MGCKTRAVHRVFQCVCFMLLHLFCTAQDEMRLSCRTAPSELVFILDGSWSVDDINFEIVKRWLVNITTSFKIGEKFTQVGVVQYSDNPILHIPLGNPYSSEELIKQMENIEYMGGNTRTGTAIQFATEKLFVTSKRGSKRTARIAVVLTDGKSQDEVAEAAEAARHQGVILFAIGVGAQTEELELKAIANKPSSTYVFYVEDYKAMSKIREVIRQKLCEEIVCPAKISVDSRDEKGFDLLMFLNLAKKGKKTQGSYYGTKAYEVSPRVDLSMSTRALFPDGLPPSYVFVSTLRYMGSLTMEEWDLWRIQTLDNKPQMAITLSGIDSTVRFTTTSAGPSWTQTVVFKRELSRKLFDESWHQLRLLVTEQEVTLYVDDLEIETLPLKASIGIFINGKTQVGKYVRKESTAPFEVQKLRIYCDPEQNSRETACEIPGVDGECANLPMDMEPTPDPCVCPPGAPGPQGMKGEQGKLGEAGRPGPAGAEGKPGVSGSRGSAGPPGPPGTEGSRGVVGYKGEQGTAGISGERGVPGLPGPLGQTGTKGSTGLPGSSGGPGKDGKAGEKGSRGPLGSPGYPGEPGLPGRNGKDGFRGMTGEKGERGTVGMPGQDGREGHPGMPGQPGTAGQRGTKGEFGLPGPRGTKGSSGMPGDMGSAGVPGPSGQTGPKGSQGESGQPGVSGSPGPEGKSGEPGSVGQPGHPGMPGLEGLKGQRGDPGERGVEGMKGEGGEHGRPGDPGSPGLSGMKGEKGPPGEPGQRGSMGHQGQAGLPGQMGPAGPRGQSGDIGLPGDPGAEGRPGKELTEIHIKQICREVLRSEMPSLLISNMNHWRSCDECQSRAGSPGPQGPQGPQGSRGFAGLPGSSGQPGHPGRPGRSGLRGLKGDPGVKGDKGNQGRTDIGDQGPPGPPGPLGPQGYSKPGQPGKPGSPGMDGEEGKRGGPGSPGQPGVCHPSMCYSAMMRHQDPFRKGPNY